MKKDKENRRVSLYLARLFLTFGTSALVACAGFSRIDAFSNAERFWAITSDHGVVESMSVSKVGSEIDVYALDYVSIARVDSAGREIALYDGRQDMQDDLRNIRVEASRLMPSMLEWLQRISHAEKRAVRLYVYLLPTNSSFRVERRSASSDSVDIFLYFSDQTTDSKDRNSRFVALQRVVSTALHETTHAMQLTFAPGMRREAREEQAHLVGTCFWVDSLPLGETLYHGHSSYRTLNPVFSASDAAEKKVTEELFHYVGIEQIDANDAAARAKVDTYCRDKLGF